MAGLLILGALCWWTWHALTEHETAPEAFGQTVAAGKSAAAFSRSTTTVPVVSRDDLRREADRYPRDGRRRALLAYAEFEANNYAQAAAAFEAAVEVSPKVAADPGVLCDWADALGMAQGGTLNGRPTELISRALALRPTHPKALEMAGSAAYGQREFALAADYWRRLLRQMPEDSAGYRALAGGIERAERLAATTLPHSRP